jgi:hypothetical protein
VLKITTLNSVYEVRHNGTVFQVKKVGELNPSSMFNAVGQVRDSTYMKLGIGSPAQFDYWRTSTVVNIESSEGGTVDNACQSQSQSPSPSAQEKEEYNEAETLP